MQPLDLLLIRGCVIQNQYIVQSFLQLRARAFNLHQFLALSHMYKQKKQKKNNQNKNNHYKLYSKQGNELVSGAKIKSIRKIHPPNDPSNNENGLSGSR